MDWRIYSSVVVVVLLCVGFLWVDWRMFFRVLMVILVGVFLWVYYSYRNEVGKVNLCKGYFKQMENAKKFRNDPNFDYDKYIEDLNTYMKERLKQ